MNKAMLQQNNLQNQGSWINDDPFDLLWTQEVTSLSAERDLHLYAQDLVEQYAKFDGECYNVTFEQLSDSDQSQLLAKYFEFNDRETDCLNGDDFSIDNDYTCALLKILKDNTPETRENLATVIHKNISIYYAKEIQKVLGDACDDYLHNINNEQGYYAVQSRESGDVEWSKI
jgi:hypothetical protein